MKLLQPLLDWSKGSQPGDGATPLIAPSGTKADSRFHGRFKITNRVTLSGEDGAGKTWTIQGRGVDMSRLGARIGALRRCVWRIDAADRRRVAERNRRVIPHATARRRDETGVHRRRSCNTRCRLRSRHGKEYRVRDLFKYQPWSCYFSDDGQVGHACALGVPRGCSLGLRLGLLRDRSSDLFEASCCVLVEQAGDQRLIRQTLGQGPLLNRLQVLA